jgi:hypothetical protein
VRLDHVARAGLAQFDPQPGNQCLQRIAGVARRIVGPEFPGQRADRDDTPGVQREQSEQDPQPAAADMDWAPRLVPHLKRAQQPDTQRVRHLPSLIARILALLPRIIQRVGSPYAS